MWGLWIGLAVAVVVTGVVVWRRGGSTPSMAMWTEIGDAISPLQTAAAASVREAGADTVAASAMARQTAVLRKTLRLIYTIERDGDHVSHVVSSQLVTRKPEKYQIESMLVVMMALMSQLKLAGIEGDEESFEIGRSDVGTHFLGLRLTAEQNERFMAARTG